MSEDFSEMHKKVKQILRKLPRKIGVDAMQFFQQNFKKQGFVDKYLERWPKRQVDLLLLEKKAVKRKKGAKKIKRKRPSRRGILRLTGDLSRSLEYKTKYTLTGNKITIFTRTDYAQFHNEGLPMKNGKRMTKRQFVGKSDALNKKIKKLIEKSLSEL